LETVFGCSWDLDFGTLDGLEGPGQKVALNKLASMDSEVNGYAGIRLRFAATDSRTQHTE